MGRGPVVSRWGMFQFRRVSLVIFFVVFIIFPVFPVDQVFPVDHNSLYSNLVQVTEMNSSVTQIFSS